MGIALALHKLWPQTLASRVAPFSIVNPGKMLISRPEDKLKTAPCPAVYESPMTRTSQAS